MSADSRPHPLCHSVIDKDPQDRSPHPRWTRKAEIFGINKDRNAVPALLEALQGEYFTVRSWAVLALEKLAIQSNSTAALCAKRHRRRSPYRGLSLRWGHLKDPSTFDDITNVLLDDPKIRSLSGGASLREYTTSCHVPPICWMLLPFLIWWYEREYAACDLLLAIEKMGFAAVTPLISALQEKEGTVRKFAAILLGKSWATRVELNHSAWRFMTCIMKWEKHQPSFC